MPKSKVTQSAVPAPSAASTSRIPVKINSSGTPIWYKIIMFGLMLVGLLWLVVNYLAGPSIAFMRDLNAWNYAIGFGLFILGLVMTTGWR